MKKRMQKTLVIDGERYLIVIIARTQWHKICGLSYRIQGPGLDFESFTNLPFSLEVAMARLVEKVKNSAFRAYLAHEAGKKKAQEAGLPR